MRSIGERQAAQRLGRADGAPPVWASRSPTITVGTTLTTIQAQPSTSEMEAIEEHDGDLRGERGDHKLYGVVA